MGDKAHQSVVVAIHIEQTDRLVVVAELAPGPDFKKFLQGTDPAWQSQECVGPFGHHAFALMHGVHHMKFTAALVRPLPLDKRLGNDADDAATAGQRGVCKLPHQAIVAAAVDQLAAMTPNPLADGLGGSR